MMMTLPSALLPALIFTGTPEKIPAGSHHLVRPLAAVETPHALPARAGSVIMAAGSISQEVIATVRQRYPWQPLVLFTDEDGRAGWEARYDLLLLPFVLWEQLTSMDVLTTYIDLAETRRVQSISQNVSRIVHDIADPQAQLTYMAQALKHAVPFDAMNIFMRDDNSLRMLFHYGYENTPGNYSEDMRLPLKYASQMSVLNSGEVKLIADVNTHPDWETPSLESVDWIRSWLGIPVRRYGEVVGLIGMDAAHTNQFNDLHASRMQQLEDDISALVAAVDLEEMIDRSTHLVSAIRRQNLLMSIQFADRTSLEGVCRAIAETVVGVFGQMDCGVMLLSENRTELKRYARAGEYEVQATAPLYLNGRGLAVEAVRSGSAIYAPDVTADARYIPNEPRTRAELAIPLKLHDETIGVLDLQSARYHAFSNMDRDALAVFADHAATAIENVRLEMLTRDYTQQLEQRVADRTRELNLAVKRAETVLNRTSDVIVLLDSAGHIQQTNAAFNRLFGVQPDELFDVCLCKLATKAYHDDLLSKEIQKRSNGAVTSVDVQMKGKGGRVFDAEVTFAPIPASVGDGLEIVCSIRDITRHKEEKDLLHALLHRERQLNELKSRFIRTVTHEFRTPLTVIFSSMELLRDYYDRLKPERRQKHFDQIAAEVRHMETLLEDALYVEQAQDQQTPFNPRNIDLVQLATPMVNTLNTVNTAPQIAFTHDDGTTPFAGDPKLIQNIMRNLLTNAVKYAPGTETVYLNIATTDDTYEITVRDEGAGIPADEIEHLFQPFFRANNATAFPGNGLGLSILKDAVDLHGGTISVESELEKGTTFVVRLPRTTDKSP